jgi:AdoMet-dependent heme synthase
MKMISQFSGYICRNPLTSWRSILGYTLIVEHSRGVMLTLSEVAGFIWKSTDNWVHTDQVMKAVQNEYNVDMKTAQRDTLSFIQQLLSLGLLINLQPLDKADSSIMIELKESLPNLHEQFPIKIKNLCEIKHIPIVAFLELTRKCNLDCIHCYNGGSGIQELNFNQVKILLDDLAELGCLDLVLTGGEPFLHKDFEDILWYARDKHFCITLKTNGTLISKRLASLLRKTLVSEVHISIYSLKPSEHEEITNTPGSLAKSLHGIECLLEEGIKVRISTPITKINYLSGREIKEFADRINTDVGFDPIITAQVDGSRNPVALRIDKDDWQKLLDNGLLSEVIYPNTVNLNDLSSIQSGVSKPIAENELICGAGNSSVAINALGDVIPCICLPLKMGNILENSIKSIWRDEKAWHKMRNLTKNQFTDCANCKLIEYCPRCPEVSFLETGKLTGVAPVICTSASFLAQSRGM